MHLVTGYAGREHITSADFGSFNIAFVGADERVFDRGRMFAATIVDNNTVTIADGDLIMQGRHARIIENHVESLTFDNGQRGFYRHDLIVATYEKDSQTAVESMYLEVIKGVQTEDAASVQDPAYIHADITEATGALKNQMPLYRIIFEGSDITSAVRLFDYVYAHDHLIDDMWDDVHQVTSDAQDYYDTEEARYTQMVNDAQTTIDGDIADFNTQMDARIDRADEILVEMQEHYSYMEEYTFLASGWNSTTKEYSLETRYPSEYYDILSITSSNANTTAEMLEAWQSAQIYGYEPTNKVVAHEDVPQIDITMALLVLNKRDQMSP